MVLGVGAEDHRWNKKAGVAVFCFLCWKYCLLLVSVFGTVRDFFSVNTQIVVMNQYLTTRL